MSLVSEVQIALDEAAGSVFWPLEQIYDALNEAQLAVYNRAKLQADSVLLVTPVNSDILQISSTLMIPQYFESDGHKYFPTTHAKLEQWDRAWKGTRQGPTKWLVKWDAEHIRCFPRPDLPYYFFLWGIPYPPEISAALTDTDAPRLVKQAVIFRAAGALLEHTHPNIASNFVQDSETFIADFNRSRRNQQSHNIRRLRPGTAFTSAQSGVISVGRQFS